MSQEQPRGMKITLDRTPEVAELQKLLDKTNIELGKMQEINKALLAQDVERERKAIEAKMDKKVPLGGDTCRLDQDQLLKPRIEAEGSFIEPSWVKGDNAEEVVSKIEHLSHVADNKEDFERIKSKLTKKILNHGLNIEFQGDSRLFLKHELPISEFDSVEAKQQKKQFNEKLRINRQNWRNLSED